MFFCFFDMVICYNKEEIVGNLVLIKISFFLLRIEVLVNGILNLSSDKCFRVK